MRTWRTRSYEQTISPSLLSAQTRPDLTCSVSLAQQLQKAPCIADVRFTNQIASRAGLYKDMGLRFRPIPEDQAQAMCHNHIGVVVCHDAAWANALEATYDEEGFQLTEEDQQAGLQLEGPHAERQQRKAKRVNSKVASQMGCLTLFVDMSCVAGFPGNASIADWKSRAGSGFAEEPWGRRHRPASKDLKAGSTCGLSRPRPRGESQEPTALPFGLPLSVRSCTQRRKSQSSYRSEVSHRSCGITPRAKGRAMEHQAPTRMGAE